MICSIFFRIFSSMFVRSFPDCRSFPVVCLILPECGPLQDIVLSYPGGLIVPFCLFVPTFQDVSQNFSGCLFYSFKTLILFCLFPLILFSTYLLISKMFRGSFPEVLFSSFQDVSSIFSMDVDPFWVFLDPFRLFVGFFRNVDPCRCCSILFKTWIHSGRRSFLYIHSILALFGSFLDVYSILVWFGSFLDVDLSKGVC